MNTEQIEVRRYLHHSLPTRRDVVAMVFRHWKSMAIASGLLIVATVLAGIWTPRYEARMKILVESRRSDAVVSSSSIAPVQFNGNMVTEEDLNSEVELLTGDDLLRKVVLATGAGAKAGTSIHPEDEPVISTAVRQLSRDLRAEAVRKTHVISVRYSSRDPQLASAVLKAMAAAYVEKHTEVHRPTGEFTFFDQEAERFRKNLEMAQQKLAAFSQERHVVSAQVERDAALQQANTFDSNAHQAVALIAETESRILKLQAQLNSNPPRITTAVRSAENEQLMGQLKSTLLTLQLKRTELLTKYDPGYALVKEADKQIADATAAIESAQRNPTRDETTDQNPAYELIKNELAQAQAELVGLKARESAARAIAAQYQETAQHRDQESTVQQNLQREAKTQEDGYLLYAHKSEEAGISDALDRRGIVNVAIAEQPAVPSTPSRSPLYSVVFTLVLVCSGSFATGFVMDAMDPTFRTPDELATYLQVPVLAVLPKSKE